MNDALTSTSPLPHFPAWAVFAAIGARLRTLKLCELVAEHVG
jgi:hypothetical protein